ncbi:OsmC family protein [Plastoroseomonas hellenica]|uniref:OsmC family protein n=1 Tax=Plastoroseomonas hellenica TaxID=2687306 RepID=UPI001BADEB78|nr:OsmC family protein [Plastoroseomonas hellenica]
MTTLNAYLRHKQDAFHALKARAAAPGYAPATLQATVTAEGRSGVRRIRIRDFQVLSDSPPDFVGYDLGPSSPEIALGALGSCITHTWLIQAAAFGLPLDAIEVEVRGSTSAPGCRDMTRSRGSRMASATPCASRPTRRTMPSPRCATRSSGSVPS